MPEATSSPTLDDVMAALADGPLSVSELCDRLGLPLDDEGPRPVWSLLAGPRVVGLADGRVADGVALGRGRVALHTLSAEEVALRIVRLDEDVAAPVAAASDPSRVAVGDEEVRLQFTLDDDGEEDLSVDPVIDLPDTWPPDLAEGDVVGMSVADDGGLVLTVDGLPAATSDGDDGAAAMIAALLGLGRTLGVPLAGDDDAWIIDLVDALLQIAADRPEVADGLARPLTEVLDAAGLAYGGGLLAGPGVPDHRLRLFQVGADILGGPWADPELMDQAEVLGTTWLLLLGAGDEEIPERARAAAVAASLGDQEVVLALARHVRMAEVDVGPDLLGRVTAASDVDPAGPGPAQLLAEVTLLAGMTPPAVDRLARALADVDDDEWTEAIELLGHLRAVAGDLDGAARALARIELFDTISFLDRWRARSAPTAGRNEPCPCGSGRKHKHCCLDRPARTSLADRVELLWWKARTWCLRTQGLALPWSTALDEDERSDADALVLDLALVADDALAAFTVELGPLLPSDEAALVESWLERPHRLWEVGQAEAGDLTLVDLTGPVDGSAAAVVRAPEPALSPGEVVLAVLVPTGEDRDQVVGQVVRVPSSARPAALDLLADHPTGQALLDWVLELGPDALVRPAGTSA